MGQKRLAVISECSFPDSPLSPGAGRRVLALLTQGILAIMLAACGTTGSATSVPALRELGTKDLDDLLVGSSIQATRGTDLVWMRSEIDAALRDGVTFRMVAVDDVPDDWLTVSLAGVGGGGEWEHVTERIRREGLEVRPGFLLEAVDALSEYLGRAFDAVIRAEAGEATVYALLAAARLGVPIVDACLSGRARPEIQQQVTSLVGISTVPAALVSMWGDVVIIERIADENRAEELARGISMVSGPGMAMAMTPMTGREVRRGVIQGSLSEAILYGQTVRGALENHENPVEALQRVSGATKRFHGIVTRSEIEGRKGFNVGWITISGSGPYTGEQYDIYIKNEQIAGWKNRETDVVPPNMLWVLDPHTGLPVTGTPPGIVPEGKEVSVLRILARGAWDSRKGSKLMGPSHFRLENLKLPE